MKKRFKWKNVALSLFAIMIPMVLYLMAGSVFTGCEKQDYEKGYLAIYVENEDILPVHVYLGINNKIGVVNNVILHEQDCHLADVSTELIAGTSYKLIMYGKNWTYEKEVYIQENRCKKVIAK